MRIQDIVDNTLTFLNERKKAYKLQFSSTSAPAMMVLKDLVEFSKWVEGPASPDPNETWRLIGRQDIVRRILQHTVLTDRQLFSLFNGGSVPQVTESNGDDNG